jgi:hypothetical protein
MDENDVDGDEVDEEELSAEELGMDRTDVEEGLKARTRWTITRCMITRWTRMRGKWTKARQITER